MAETGQIWNIYLFDFVNSVIFLYEFFFGRYLVSTFTHLYNKAAKETYYYINKQSAEGFCSFIRILTETTFKCAFLPEYPKDMLETGLK